MANREGHYYRFVSVEERIPPVAGIVAFVSLLSIYWGLFSVFMIRKELGEHHSKMLSPMQKLSQEKKKKGKNQNTLRAHSMPRQKRIDTRTTSLFGSVHSFKGMIFRSSKTEDDDPRIERDAVAILYRQTNFAQLKKEEQISAAASSTTFEGRVDRIQGWTFLLLDLPITIITPLRIRHVWPRYIENAFSFFLESGQTDAAKLFSVAVLWTCFVLLFAVEAMRLLISSSLLGSANSLKHWRLTLSRFLYGALYTPAIFSAAMSLQPYLSCSSAAASVCELLYEYDEQIYAKQNQTATNRTLGDSPVLLRETEFDVLRIIVATILLFFIFRGAAMYITLEKHQLAPAFMWLPVYDMIRYMVQAFICFAGGFLPLRPNFALPVFFAGFSFLFFFTYTLQPCSGQGRTANNMRATAYALGTYVSLWGLIFRVVDSGSEIDPLGVVFVCGGAGVLPLIWWVNDRSARLWAIPSTAWSNMLTRDTSDHVKRVACEAAFRLCMQAKGKMGNAKLLDRFCEILSDSAADEYCLKRAACTYLLAWCGQGSLCRAESRNDKVASIIISPNTRRRAAIAPTLTTDEFTFEKDALVAASAQLLKSLQDPFESVNTKRRTCVVLRLLDSLISDTSPKRNLLSDLFNCKFGTEGIYLGHVYYLQHASRLDHRLALSARRVHRYVKDAAEKGVPVISSIFQETSPLEESCRAICHALEKHQSVFMPHFRQISTLKQTNPWNRKVLPTSPIVLEIQQHIVDSAYHLQSQRVCIPDYMWSHILYSLTPLAFSVHGCIRMAVCALISSNRKSIAKTMSDDFWYMLDKFPGQLDSLQRRLVRCCEHIETVYPDEVALRDTNGTVSGYLKGVVRAVLLGSITKCRSPSDVKSWEGALRWESFAVDALQSCLYNWTTKQVFQYTLTLWRTKKSLHHDPKKNSSCATVFSSAFLSPNCEYPAWEQYGDLFKDTSEPVAQYYAQLIEQQSSLQARTSTDAMVCFDGIIKSLHMVRILHTMGLVESARDL